MAISAGILPTLSCPYGHYRDFTKGIMLDGCVKCPRGYFGNSTGLHTPNCTAPCPAGTYLDRRGGKGMEDCIPCPAGCFGEEEGLTKDSCTGRCEEIHRNTGKRYYGTDTGLTSRDQCKRCDVGYNYNACKWYWAVPEDEHYHYSSKHINATLLKPEFDTF